jgi:hypothetical protein
MWTYELTDGVPTRGAFLPSGFTVKEFDEVALPSNITMEGTWLSSSAAQMRRRKSLIRYVIGAPRVELPC